MSLEEGRETLNKMNSKRESNRKRPLTIGNKLRVAGEEVGGGTEYLGVGY